ncbi:MAG: sulfite exporter TauE/SafE family protein, partial [Planctomycetia bacterium]|nr:sulfite exporter TauE/SafE family protein [Planctomycetia bacterium]
VYGGYFGAGIGILMLAVLGVLGVGDMHRLNAVKNVLATAINGVATGLFAAGSLLGSHSVSWSHAAVMAVAAVAGSLAGSLVARRLPAAGVRRCVALIGFGLAAYYLVVKG